MGRRGEAGKNGASDKQGGGRVIKEERGGERREGKWQVESGK